MTDKTLFRPDWYQDPNDNRIHDENGDDILDKHSVGELQKAVNSHDALVAALEAAIPMLTPATRTIGGTKRARLAAEAALEQVK
tara:strand:- start:189 stop:440 length:252 start_codon:yes stop_codon:yes gene_type:complete